ncbi:MAG: division/cell wall cluster transcriptional repressor MraZ [Acidimicrobiia bacterium]
MFVGKAFHRIDEKGRLVLPSSFRKALQGDDSVIIAQHEDGCLMLLRESDFMAMAQERKSDQIAQADTRKQFRFFASSAQQLDLDKAGRLLINEEFREFANIELGGEVAITGMVDYAEIWNRARFDVEYSQGAAGFRVDENDEEVPPA